MNNLQAFDSSTPGTINISVGITGLQSGEVLPGIDFRPANKMLYGLGSGGRLYTINTGSGAATQVGSGTFSPAPASASTSTPRWTASRVVSDSNQNLCLNPDSGALAATDTSLAFDTADFFAGQNPNVVGSA